MFPIFQEFFFKQMESILSRKIFCTRIEMYGKIIMDDIIGSYFNIGGGLYEQRKV